MSTDPMTRRQQDCTKRLHVRLPEAHAETLADEYLCLSEGLRAAVRHCIDEAPLSRWPADGSNGADIQGQPIHRSTFRLSPGRYDELESVVDTYRVPDRSRAIRDAVRDLLEDEP